MKYLILVIVSLFYLTSFSSHKEQPSLSDEERNRYYELHERHWLLNEKEQIEYDQLKKKTPGVVDEILVHFNNYMWFEMQMDQALKEDPEYQRAVFHHIFPDLHKKTHPLRSIFDYPYCTKEGLKKENCPKAPYNAIYWAKKYFESGHCVWRASSRMSQLIGNYVIPKTDMEDNEDFFHILHYVSFYFIYQDHFHKDVVHYRSLEKKAKIELEKAKKNPNFEIQKEAYLKNEGFLNRKKKVDKRAKFYKDKALDLRSILNEKQKEIAEKMISDLIQKWSKKYGKDQIYECRSDSSLAKKAEMNRDFLDKKYPYHSLK